MPWFWHLSNNLSSNHSMVTYEQAAKDAVI
jgi:hypothetical protein